ncbi:MAG: TraR/DksA family transcriptional regulator [Limisphaerales bacterium]
MEKRAAAKPSAPGKATTKDVLGADFSKEVPEKWRKYYDRLIGMRSFLRRRKETQVNAANQQNLRHGEHMGDVGTNSYEKDLALSRVSSEQDALFEIDAALDRIQDGTYGICEMTGKQIEPDRLDAIPWTRFSAEAERKLEEEGQIKTAQIPPPERIGRSTTTNRLGEEWNREPQPSDKPEDKKD